MLTVCATDLAKIMRRMVAVLLEGKQCTDDARGLLLNQHFVILDGVEVLQKCSLEKLEAVGE